MLYQNDFILKQMSEFFIGVDEFRIPEVDFKGLKAEMGENQDVSEERIVEMLEKSHIILIKKLDERSSDEIAEYYGNLLDSSSLDTNVKLRLAYKLDLQLAQNDNTKNIYNESIAILNKYLSLSENNEKMTNYFNKEKLANAILYADMKSLKEMYNVLYK